MTVAWPQFLRVDPYLVAFVATVVLASLFPARGIYAVALEYAVPLAIAGLFFAYGVRLSTRQVLDAMLRWRPQLVVFASTFVVFPIVGWTLVWALGGTLDEGLSTGLLFLAILPSTVQSSIAFTSIAGGNVAAAVCSASVSNLAGVVLTPLLMTLVIGSAGGHATPSNAMRDIAVQILLPFLVGQGARPWLAAWAERHQRAATWFDRGSILLVAYSAFSAGMLAGVWENVSTQSLISVLLLDVLLLATILTFTICASRLLGFDRGDEIAIVFCGSKKSMATGIPMANVLFAPHAVSAIVIPLMLFHQLQIFVSAVIAQRYARTRPAPEP